MKLHGDGEPAGLNEEYRRVEHREMGMEDATKYLSCYRIFAWRARAKKLRLRLLLHTTLTNHEPTTALDPRNQKQICQC